MDDLNHIDIIEDEPAPRTGHPFSTLKVRIKNEDKKLNHDFLIYETYQADQDDPIIRRCVAEALRGFDGEPDDIDVTIKLSITGRSVNKK